MNCNFLPHKQGGGKGDQMLIRQNVQLFVPPKKVKERGIMLIRQNVQLFVPPKKYKKED